MHSKYGLAYPDIAAQGQGYQVIISRVTMSVAGTSASIPMCPPHPPFPLDSHTGDDARAPIPQTFASVISLLNDFRLTRGKSPLGFINPITYTAPAGVQRHHSEEQPWWDGGLYG